MNEHGFIDAVHRRLPADPSFMKWKIHDSFAGGKPDAYYCGPLNDLWVEYKFIELPKRVTTQIYPDLSELQIDWLRFLDACRRPVWVVVGSPKLAGIFSVQEALDGFTKPQYLGRAVSFKDLASRITEHCGVFSG